jgi:3-methyl-2-oxobutanoate hydroxymethyltransferase
LVPTATKTSEAGVTAVGYEERRHPTMIRTPDGDDIEARGTFWIETGTGRVLKTELRTGERNERQVRATITVTYEPNERLRMLVPASMDEMIVLTRAVTRGARRPLVIADMPFGSFQVSDAEALTNAIRFVKEAGADAVKLEGAGPSLSRVRAIVGAGIPVMGHIGLTPQSATALGGFKAQGRTADQARRLVDDARALEAAGCFSIVLECIPASLAARIRLELTIPTIGIGAGPDTDGQVLVLHDLLGLDQTHTPRFVRRYADGESLVTAALDAYDADVKEARFPVLQESYR